MGCGPVSPAPAGGPHTNERTHGSRHQVRRRLWGARPTRDQRHHPLPGRPISCRPTDSPAAQHAAPSFQVVIVMLPTSQRTQRRLDIPRLYLVKQLPRALWKTACIDTITSSSGAEALLSPRLPRSIAKARSIAKDREFEAVRALSTVNHAIQVSLSGDSRSPDRTP
jgi:hypothetical protein